jgi:hypothetical protein
MLYFVGALNLFIGLLIGCLTSGRFRVLCTAKTCLRRRAMEYWKNYVDIFLKEEDYEVVKMLRSFVDKEIMPVRHLIDGNKDHTLVKKILQGMTNLGLRMAPKNTGVSILSPV